MKTLLGQKVGMTRVTDQHGLLVGATVIQAAPNSVTAVRTLDKDGYSAIQLGYGDASKANKPQRAQLTKAKAAHGQSMIEVRTDGSESLPELGSELTVETFKPGDVVNVTATSKGHGFTGTVKRHHFHIGPRSHGSMNLRRPGSIGAQQPQRVIKGKRMAGRMGGARATVQHLEVLDILPDEQLLVLKGAVPGIKGALLRIAASPRHVASSHADQGGEE